MVQTDPGPARDWVVLTLMKSLLILILALGVPMLTLGAPAGRRHLLDNRTFRVEVDGSRVTSLQVDPAGMGEYGPNWVLDLGFDAIAETPETALDCDGASVHITGLQEESVETLSIQNGGVADKLEPGRSLGQTFTVKSGHFSKVEARTPTWWTKDSDATLSLRRDGPAGELIAQRWLEDIADNSWQSLEFAKQGAGLYYLELSDPKGDVGWWSSRDKAYVDGQGFVGGKPAEGVEREMRVAITRGIGDAEVTVALKGAELEFTAAVRPHEGEQPRAHPLEMTVRWDNEGYEVSDQTVPFFRFLTDTMRYMPTQQLKRWTQRGGRYELSFGGARWIEADGTGNHDLRFVGKNLGLSWHLGGKETMLRFTSGAANEDGASTTRVTLQARPREDSVPGNWPRFVMPDAQDSVEATTFLYERDFTYPPVWGPGAWLEWNQLGRVWQFSPHLGTLRHFLLTYQMSEDGYVHTWGGNPGWPFPDNKRWDTRHFDTNARLILGSWRFAAWHRDDGFLKGQAERLRKAMEYQLTVLKGADGLIISASKDVNGRHEGVGNNYWDILPFGHLDAYANAVWYASLEAMAQFEEMLTAIGGVETTVPARAPEYYRGLAIKARDAYNETFWDEDAGRYIGCVDIDGKRHDYGFTFVNVEAMAYGLASDEQARRIYHWMETEPTSSGDADTYSKWIFAPRANTLHNPPWNPEEGKLSDVPQEPWWHFGWRGTPYNDQCQDGGAILYTSYFDLMSRLRHLGASNAWKHWQEIVARWRMPDHLCGGTPLYRGEHPQQINAGAVGLDIPFPESGLVPCWLLYGALGVEATAEGLVIAPRLPAEVPQLSIENVAYRGLPLNIEATREQVTVSCGAPGHEFKWQAPLGEEGRVVFTQPPAPVRFPDTPLWRNG